MAARGKKRKRTKMRELTEAGCPNCGIPLVVLDLAGQVIIAAPPGAVDPADRVPPEEQPPMLRDPYPGVGLLPPDALTIVTAKEPRERMTFGEG